MSENDKYTAEFLGGVADGVEELAVLPFPDLVDGYDRNSYMILSDSWYILRAIDFNNKKIYYEPVSLNYFPDAILGPDGVAILGEEQSGGSPSEISERAGS